MIAAVASAGGYEHSSAGAAANSPARFYFEGWWAYASFPDPGAFSRHDLSAAIFSRPNVGVDVKWRGYEIGTLADAGDLVVGTPAVPGAVLKLQAAAKLTGRRMPPYLLCPYPIGRAEGVWSNLIRNVGDKAPDDLDTVFTAAGVADVGAECAAMFDAIRDKLDAAGARRPDGLYRTSEFDFTDYAVALANSTATARAGTEHVYAGRTLNQLLTDYTRADGLPWPAFDFSAVPPWKTSNAAAWCHAQEIAALVHAEARDRAIYQPFRSAFGASTWAGEYNIAHRFSPFGKPLRGYPYEDGTGRPMGFYGKGARFPGRSHMITRQGNSWPIAALSFYFDAPIYNYGVDVADLPTWYNYCKYFRKPANAPAVFNIADQVPRGNISPGGNIEAFSVGDAMYAGHQICLMQLREQAAASPGDSLSVLWTLSYLREMSGVNVSAAGLYCIEQELREALKLGYSTHILYEDSYNYSQSLNFGGVVKTVYEWWDWLIARVGG